jgi:signal transduction histidine kinase/ligand-binding sensor domain-containing protein
VYWRRTIILAVGILLKCSLCALATLGGLDRFHEVAVPTFTERQGLLNPRVWSVLASRDGSLWLGTPLGLGRWHNGQMTRFGAHGGLLNGAGPGSLFEDRHGRIWVSTNREFGYLEKDRFIPISTVPGGWVFSIVEDTAGDIWIVNQQHGLMRLRGEVVEQIPWGALGRRDLVLIAIADPRQGGIWLGFETGDIAYFSGGQLRMTYSARDGLGAGEIFNFRFDPEGALWTASQGGLSRLKDGVLATLSSKNGLPCDTVHWSIEDEDRALWLFTACGLVRIARSEVDAGAAAVEKDKHTKLGVGVTVFDSSDGVRSNLLFHSYTPRVAKTTDGKLWFLPIDGVSVVDPRRLRHNELPPPVHIEQVIANGKSYEAAQDVRLPPLVRDLWINYTALSFVVPEKVRFRYMLEGQDPDGKEFVNDRQAHYSNLRPGRYRFRVMAANNSGVWNEERAFLDFVIAPALYQRTSFRVLCAVALIALLFVAYRLRVRQLAHQFNRTFEARLSERTRIARGLHDTLLQSFQGLLLRFQSVSNVLPANPLEAKHRLDSALDQAAEAITEGRDAVQGLRSSAIQTNDLANGIIAFGQELSNTASTADPPFIEVEVEGGPRQLNPVVRDEAYRIAGEALRNAFQHARAQRVTVEIRYDRRRFCLRVRDDGQGISAETIRRGHSGHFGLHGMRERAEVVGGQLEVWSKLDSGTQIELSIPGTIAYDTSVRRSWLSQLLSGNNRDHGSTRP